MGLCGNSANHSSDVSRLNTSPPSTLNSKYHNNVVKVSYSCMGNIERIMKKHKHQNTQTKTNQTLTKPTQQSGATARRKPSTPLGYKVLGNKRLTSSPVYNAKVATSQRRPHMKEFYSPPTNTPYANRKFLNSTELSKFIVSTQVVNSNLRRCRLQQ